MELRLQSSRSKTAFGLSCLLLVATFEICSLRQYWAYREYTNLTVPSLQKAMQLDSWNAEYVYLLGRIYLYEDQNFTAAQSAFNRAIALNPHNARYWLDLASIAQINGDSAGEEAALDRAAAAEPTMPRVSWEVANFYLLRGDLPKAFSSLGRVEQYSPQLRKQAVEVSWRAQPNVDILLQYMPHTVDTLSSLLQILYEQHNLEAAAKVWHALVALRQPINPDYARNYLSALLAYDDPHIETAQRSWTELVSVNPDLAEYVNANNLVVNGSFENDVLGWGFDWQYYKRPHVEVAQENGVSHGGSRSLSISFDGADILDFGIFQYVAVKPNTHYQVQAFVRADNVVGSSGPRLGIVAPFDFSQRFYTSDDMLGSSVWSAQRGSFSTGADTHMVAIVLLRDPPYDPIKGHLWLDDISITPEDGP